MAFCRNCGTQIAPTDSFCKSCGAIVGAQILPNQAPYNQQLKPRKSKAVSILLAVFLTFWTWLYTYRRNNRKFWLGLILSSLPILFAVVALEFYVSVSWIPESLFIALSYLLPMAIWLWAIVDTISKKQEWYDNY